MSVLIDTPDVLIYTPAILPTKYEVNHLYIKKYLKNRYANDEEYKKKNDENAIMLYKKRYANDAEFRERAKMHVRNSRERMKLLKEENNKVNILSL